MRFLPDVFDTPKASAMESLLQTNLARMARIEQIPHYLAKLHGLTKYVIALSEELILGGSVVGFGTVRPVRLAGNRQASCPACWRISVRCRPGGLSGRLWFQVPSIRWPGEAI